MVDLPITKWIKKKIRRLIAIVEDTDVATHSIASGKYVVWKGDLCKSTAPIAVGGALSLSNLSPVSDGGLNELSEHMANVDTELTLAARVTSYVKSLGNVTANTDYEICTIANVIPAGKTFFGAMKSYSSGNYDVDNGTIYWNVANTKIYFVPKTSQPGMTVKVFVFYR